MNTILMTAPSIAHPGFTWVAALDACGCQSYLRRPIRNDHLEAAAKFLSPQGYTSKMEYPASDEPGFLPSRRLR